MALDLTVGVKGRHWRSFDELVLNSEMEGHWFSVGEDRALMLSGGSIPSCI